MVTRKQRAPRFTREDCQEALLERGSIAYVGASTRKTANGYEWKVKCCNNWLWIKASVLTNRNIGWTGCRKCKSLRRVGSCKKQTCIDCKTVFDVKNKREFPRCKICEPIHTREKNRVWRQENREHHLAKKKEYRETENGQARAKKHSRKYFLNNRDHIYKRHSERHYDANYGEYAEIKKLVNSINMEINYEKNKGKEKKKTANSRKPKATAVGYTPGIAGRRDKS